MNDHTCITCKHYEKSSTQKPCFSCSGGSYDGKEDNWQQREEPVKSCETCQDMDKIRDCRSECCSPDYIDWAPEGAKKSCGTCGHEQPCYNLQCEPNGFSYWVPNEEIESRGARMVIHGCSTCRYVVLLDDKEQCLSCTNNVDGDGATDKWEPKDELIPSVASSEIATNDFTKILLPIADLLYRKNQDYGNGFDELRGEYGEVAFLVRLGDKIGRLKSLQKHSALVKDESTEDTIRDIIGYCTLELRYRERKKEGSNHAF